MECWTWGDVVLYFICVTCSAVWHFKLHQLVSIALKLVGFVVFRLPYRLAREFTLVSFRTRSPDRSFDTFFEFLSLYFVKWVLNTFDTATVRTVFFSERTARILFAVRRFKYGTENIYDFDYQPSDVVRGYWLLSKNRRTQPVDLVIYFVPGALGGTASAFFYLEYLSMLLVELQVHGFQNPALFCLDINYVGVDDKGGFVSYMDDIKEGYLHTVESHPRAKSLVMGSGLGGTSLVSLLLHLARPDIPFHVDPEPERGNASTESESGTATETQRAKEEIKEAPAAATANTALRKSLLANTVYSETAPTSGPRPRFSTGLAFAPQSDDEVVAAEPMLNSLQPPLSNVTGPNTWPRHSEADLAHDLEGFRSFQYLMTDYDYTNMAEHGSVSDCSSDAADDESQSNDHDSISPSTSQTGELDELPTPFVLPDLAPSTATATRCARLDLIDEYTRVKVVPRVSDSSDTTPDTTSSSLEPPTDFSPMHQTGLSPSQYEPIQNLDIEQLSQKEEFSHEFLPQEQSQPDAALPADKASPKTVDFVAPIPLPDAALLISPFSTTLGKKSDIRPDFITFKVLQQLSVQLVSATDKGNPLLSPDQLHDLEWWAKAMPSRGIVIMYGGMETARREIEELIGRMSTCQEARVFSECNDLQTHAWPITTAYSSRTSDMQLYGIAQVANFIERMLFMDSHFRFKKE